MELQWPLIIFTTLVAWSAGLFASQCIVALKGGAKKSQMTAWIVAAILLVVGGISVFFHLGHAERLFNGFGHLTSGITQELIAIVVLGIVAIIFLVAMRRSEDRTTVPAWVAIVGIVVAIVLVIVMAHSYTMVSRPAWNTVAWIAYVLGNACILGPATLALIMAAKGDDLKGIGIIVLAGAVVAIATAIAYTMAALGSADAFASIGSYYFDPTLPNKPMADAAGSVASISTLAWVGGVLVGTVVPAAIAAVGLKKTDKTWIALGAAIVVLALIGAICMRVAFYTAGVSIFMFF